MLYTELDKANKLNLNFLIQFLDDIFSLLKNPLDHY